MRRARPDGPSGLGAGRRPFHRHHAGQLADDVDQFGIRRQHDLGVVFERGLDRLELARQLGVADEILLRRLVDQLDGQRLALGLEDPGLLDALGLLDLGPALAVGRGFGGGREVDGRDLRPPWMAEVRKTQERFSASFSALTTLFMVSCTSGGGSISLSSARAISMPQCVDSLCRVLRSSVLMRSRSLLALLSVSVPTMLRSVVRVRLTICSA
jgi:hypothetical protein